MSSRPWATGGLNSNDSQEYLVEEGARNESFSRGKRQSQSGLSTIAISSACMIVPVLILSTVLLAATYIYLATESHSSIPGLEATNRTAPDADYLVRINSTVYLTIASWMSSLTPLLITFSVTLGSFPIAEKLLHNSRKQEEVKLMSTFQLYLYLNLASGSYFTGFWDWFIYKLGLRKLKSISATTLALTEIGTVAATTMFLSFLIFLADSWLHLTTSTTIYTELNAVNATLAPYSFNILSPNCTATDNTFSALVEQNLTCNIDPANVALIQSQTSLRTLNDVSNAIETANNGPDENVVYLGVTDDHRNPAYDFAARTYGMRSVCAPITTQCEVSPEISSNLSYSCFNGTFNGDLLSKTFAYMYNLGADTTTIPNSNPFQYVLATLQSLDSPVPSLLADPEIVTVERGGGFIFMLECNVTVLDVEYTLVNGTVTNLISSQSNTSVTNIWLNPLEQAVYGVANVEATLPLAAQLAGSAADIADSFGPGYSKIALSVGIGGLVQRPVTALQERKESLVAKVPKDALFTLLAASLLFAFLGIALTYRALKTSQEAREAQARLSLAGLVSYAFGSKEAYKSASGVGDLFEELSGATSVKIGIDKDSKGGYAFKSFL